MRLNPAKVHARARDLNESLAKMSPQEKAKMGEGIAELLRRLNNDMDDDAILRANEPALQMMRDELGPEYSVRQYFNECRTMMTEIRHLASNRSVSSNCAMKDPVRSAKRARWWLQYDRENPDGRKLWSMREMDAAMAAS